MVVGFYFEQIQKSRNFSSSVLLIYLNIISEFIYKYKNYEQIGTTHRKKELHHHQQG